MLVRGGLPGRMEDWQTDPFALVNGVIYKNAIILFIWMFIPYHMIYISEWINSVPQWSRRIQRTGNWKWTICKKWYCYSSWFINCTILINIYLVEFNCALLFGMLNEIIYYEKKS